MDPLHFVVLVVNIYLSLYLVSVRMETKINLPIAQRLALKKLRALVGNEQVHLVFAQGTDVLRAHLDAFMQCSRSNSTSPRLLGICHTYPIIQNTGQGA